MDKIITGIEIALVAVAVAVAAVGIHLEAIPHHLPLHHPPHLLLLLHLHLHLPRGRMLRDQREILVYH